MNGDHLPVIDAVSSRDDDVGLILWPNTDQSASAEVAAGLLETDDPWVRARARFLSADDTLAISVEFAIRTHAGRRLTARLGQSEADACHQGNKSNSEFRHITSIPLGFELGTMS